MLSSDLLEGTFLLLKGIFFVVEESINSASNFFNSPGHVSHCSLGVAR